MICPICQKGNMIEPAPEMLQCAGCGNGSTGRGFHYSWSLSSVDSVENVRTGITLTYDKIKDTYTIGTLVWELGVDGEPDPTSVVHDTVATIDEEEYGDYPLPVVWFGKPGKLKNKMYKTTLGKKEKT